MTLHDRFVATGQILFRFRSFLPLGIVIGLCLLFWQVLPRNAGNIAVWQSAALVVMGLGIAVRCAVIGQIPTGTSGRNTKSQKASTLNTTGIYSLVRNPLYLGNILMWVGTVLLFENLELVAAITVALLLYYLFVVYTEEDFLRGQFGTAYRDYASKTPALLPRFRGWTASKRAFSWKMVIRREHDSIFSAATGLVIAAHGIAYRTHGKFSIQREWFIPWAVLAGVWLVVKFLKKRTTLLKIHRT